MANYFKDWIFNQLPKYHQRTDSYKDVEGNGLLKRYLRVVGIELDEEFISYIDNFTDLIDYIECDDKYLPLIGSILGYPPSIDGLSTTYRKILANIMAIYKVKGTIRSYEMLFNLLGLEVSILEEVPKKAVTYDLPGRFYDKGEQYDSHCEYCSGYWILYNSKDDTCNVHNAVEAPLLDTVKNIICFLNPINATFLGMIEKYKVCDDLILNIEDEINFCTAPMNLVSIYDSIQNTVKLQWVGTGTFELEYGEYLSSSFTGPTPATSEMVIEDLLPNIVYEFRVRKICDVDSVSSWAYTLVFTGDGIANTTGHKVELKGIEYVKNSPKVTLLSDYSLYIDIPSPIKVLSILINDIWVVGPASVMTTPSELVSWLNTLGRGTFTLEGLNVISKDNPNLISKLIYETLEGIEVTNWFSQTNKRILDDTTITLLANYSIYLTYPLDNPTININSEDIPIPSIIEDSTDMLSWLNFLNKGTFIEEGDYIKSNSNPNLLSYISNGGIQTLFIQRDLQLLDTTNNVLLTDYAISMDFTSPITVSSIKINGEDIEGGGPFSNNDDLISWLNTLGKGVFLLEDGNVSSKDNPNLISSLVYYTLADPTEYTVEFSQRDQMVINTSGEVTTIAFPPNTILSDGEFYTQSIAAGVYDKITVMVDYTINPIPLHGGILTTDGAGPYNGFMNDGDVVFINVSLGDIFQIKLF